LDGLRSFRIAVRLFALALVGASALSACGSGKDNQTVELDFSATAEFRGVRQLPPLEMPDVTLTDTDKRPFRLREQTAGKLTFLYLGYTHCPDICPTHMADVARALDSLSESTAAQVTVVFITTDPERDTPEALREWLDLFDSRFIGLTGTREEINRTQSLLGVNPASKTDLGGGSYAVNHAAFVMAFTPEDREARLVYPAEMSWEDYAADLRALIEEGKRPS
jgi:protein SCO1/2